MAFLLNIPNMEKVEESNVEYPKSLFALSRNVLQYTSFPPRPHNLILQVADTMKIIMSDEDNIRVDVNLRVNVHKMLRRIHISKLRPHSSGLIAPSH